MNLKIDPARFQEYTDIEEMTEIGRQPSPDSLLITHIYVRAQHVEEADTSPTKYPALAGRLGTWESVDIGVLDKESLQRWLTSRLGHAPGNVWAENVVAILLGHGHFYPEYGPVLVAEDNAFEVKNG